MLAGFPTPGEVDAAGRAYLAGLDPAVRKARGCYYTPPALTRALCAAAAGCLPEPPGPGTSFLDPACGAGAFLVAARDAGFGTLCGVDVDGGAIAVARSALGAAARLEAGDALAGDPFAAWFPDILSRGGFDCVATNPPYVRAEVRSADRRRLAAQLGLRTLRDRWDLALAFVERGVRLLRPGGVGAFLLSDSYLRAQYARAQHAWLGREHAVLAVRELAGAMFPDAAVGSAILLVRAGGAGRRTITVAGDLPGRPARLAALAPRAQPARTPVAQLGELCLISYGLRANSDERRWPGAFVTADLVRDRPDAAHGRTYTEGKDLGGFRVLRTRYLEWGTARAPARFARRSFPELLDARPKILALCICGDHVRAALDTEGHAFNHTAVGVVPWARVPASVGRSLARLARGIDRAGVPDIDPGYLLAVLHDRRTLADLATWRRSKRHVYPDDWRRVRIPLCDADLMAAIAAEVARARALPYPSREFDAACGALARLLDAAFSGAR